MVDEGASNAGAIHFEIPKTNIPLHKDFSIKEKQHHLEKFES